MKIKLKTRHLELIYMHGNFCCFTSTSSRGNFFWSQNKNCISIEKKTSLLFRWLAVGSFFLYFFLFRTYSFWLHVSKQTKTAFGLSLRSDIHRYMYCVLEENMSESLYARGHHQRCSNCHHTYVGTDSIPTAMCFFFHST